MSFQNKQMIKYFHINGLLKQLVIKQSPTFLSFSFVIDCCIKVFSFLIKAFGNFEKLIRFHWQASILCKSGENWKNTDRNIFPKTYGFQRYFCLFRPSETYNFLHRSTMVAGPFSKSVNPPLLTTYNSEYWIFQLIPTNSITKNSLQLSLQIVTLHYSAQFPWSTQMVDFS